MSFTFEKVAELEYNELVSLYLIETDELLKEIFVDKVKTPFNLLYKFIKDGGEMMSTETKEVIFELFDKIISTRENLAERYQHLQKNDYINQVLEKKNIVEPDVVVEPKVVVESKPIKAPSEAKKEKSIPRRYGKDKILKDVKEQGTPATSLQRAMIDLNDIRNLYVKLSDRAIKDMFGGTENFTEEDCRKITAVIKTFKQQVESLISKKK